MARDDYTHCVYTGCLRSVDYTSIVF